MNSIGVVGGVGPYAGVDLVKKIFDQTKSKTDQDHLPVSLLSFPHRIPDRTRFLLGETDENPAIAISRIICDLHKRGHRLSAYHVIRRTQNQSFEKFYKKYPTP